MFPFALLTIWLRYVLFLSSASAQNIPVATTSSYWVANIPRQGKVAFGDQTYPVFRNVRAYGAVGASLTAFLGCVQS